MDDSERDELLIRVDERSKAILSTTEEIKENVDLLFNQSRNHESRISNMEGNRNLMFKLLGSGGLLAGLGYGINEVVKKIIGDG